MAIEGTNCNVASFKNCLEDTRIQLTFLGIGTILIALGITLVCLGQGQAMNSIGSIVTSIGVPFVTYGLFMLIYNRCVKKESNGSGQINGGQIIRPREQPKKQPVELNENQKIAQTRINEEVREKRMQKYGTNPNQSSN